MIKIFLNMWITKRKKVGHRIWERDNIWKSEKKEVQSKGCNKLSFVALPDLDIMGASLCMWGV